MAAQRTFTFKFLATSFESNKSTTVSVDVEDRPHTPFADLADEAEEVAYEKVADHFGAEDFGLESQ